jgi:hypothetical protein
MSRWVNLRHPLAPVLASWRGFFLTYSITFFGKSRPGSFGEAEMGLTDNQGCDIFISGFNETEGKTTTAPTTEGFFRQVKFNIHK